MVFLLCGKSDYQLQSGSLEVREYIGLSFICRTEYKNNYALKKTIVG